MENSGKPLSALNVKLMIHQKQEIYEASPKYADATELLLSLGRGSVEEVNSNVQQNGTANSIMLMPP